MAKIYESLFILSLDEVEGKIVDSAQEDLETALSAAVLADLTLEKKIAIEDERVNLVDQTFLDDFVLDNAITLILESARPRKLRYWLNTLQYKKLKDEIGHALVSRGLFNRKKNHLVPVGRESVPSPSFETRRHLREICLAGGQPDAVDVSLLGLLLCSGLLKLIFTRGERKAAENRINTCLLANMQNEWWGSFAAIITTAFPGKLKVE